MRPIVCRIAKPPQVVGELIVPGAEWDRDMIAQVFIPTDVEAIMSIPICTRLIEDFWSWVHEKNGVFSVRSAYCMFLETKMRREAWLEGRPANSNNERESKLWDKLQRIEVPSKVKIFLWRLAHQSIPTADVRHHQNMSTNPSCGLCGSADSWQHSLLHCTVARCVWALQDADLVKALNNTRELDAKRWLFALIDMMSSTKFIQVAVTL